MCHRHTFVMLILYSATLLSDFSRFSWYLVFLHKSDFICEIERDRLLSNFDIFSFFILFLSYLYLFLLQIGYPSLISWS